MADTNKADYSGYGTFKGVTRTEVSQEKQDRIREKTRAGNLTNK